MKRILRSLVFSLTGIAVIGASQQAFAKARKPQNGISEKFQVIYIDLKIIFTHPCFLVSPNGVIATDPIITAAEKWLKTKLKNISIKKLAM